MEQGFDLSRFVRLNKLNDPAELKKYSVMELGLLAKEVRELIIQAVSRNGGHLAPSLGTVELTLALYSVFDFPVDKIVWDVGHQAYTHKILTGRLEKFHTLRKKDGITGFPNRSESCYDAFGVGHASTSISAALGMALSRDLDGRKSHVIAVLGDGALTGGEAFEGLNHAGDLKRRLIVILNDNEMSIDRNVGAMSTYLSQLRVAPQYTQAKKELEQLLLSIPRIGGVVRDAASQLKAGVRSAFIPGSLFESMGFHYIGPLDGHNLTLLKQVLSDAKKLDFPVLIHVRTKKGKGYAPAERHPDQFHGIGKFDVETGKAPVKDGANISYTEAFSKALIRIAKERKDIVAITAAMPSGTGLKAFKDVYPKRFFDAGIAEGHATTMAAGLAADGKHPVVALYSTFAQRAYDQLIHDVCLQNLPVTFCLDRAGLVGEDGPTHHGVFDLSYLRTMPNMTIFTPKDEAELQQMLYTAINIETPTAIRYPRGNALGVPIPETMEKVPVGKAECMFSSGNVAVLAVGSMVDVAQKVRKLLLEQDVSAALYNMRFVKPLDVELILRLAEEGKSIITMEENLLAGGFGAAVCEILADAGKCVRVHRVGIPDKFIEQGTRVELFELCGFLPEQVTKSILQFLGKD